MSSVKKRLAELMKNKIQELDLNDVELLLATEEGIPMFSTSKKDPINTCVLASGIWQASSAITTLVQMDFDNEFRFSFDSTNSGIYIQKVKIGNHDYLLIMVYDQIDNPAKQKHKVRLLKDQLNLTLESENFESEDSDRSDYLFEDISDEEVDLLFAGAGN